MISVIIPTYNEDSCIENTLRQLRHLGDESNLEIIISDGCSMDRTVELAGIYAKVIRTDKGKGNQLNAGAKCASGDILFFVHADMHVPAGALNKIEQEIYENGFDGGGFLNVFDRHNQRIKKLGRILHLGLSNKSQAERKTFYGDNGRL